MLDTEYVAACRALMPPSVAVRFGAALCAQKEETFRTRTLPAVADADGRVSLAALERFTRREFGPLEWFEAHRRLDRERAAERRRKAGRDAA